MPEKHLELADIDEIVTRDNLDDKVEENIEYILHNEEGLIDYMLPLVKYKDAKMCHPNTGSRLSGEFSVQEEHRDRFFDLRYEGLFSMYSYDGRDSVGGGTYVASLDACKDEECVFQSLDLFIDEEDYDDIKEHCTHKEPDEPVRSIFIVPFRED